MTDSPVPVSVITAKEIGGANVSTLEEALVKLTPNISSYTNGMGTTMSLNGINEDYILILENGKRLAGEDRYTRINVANIKRIDYSNTYVKNKRVDYGSNIMLMVAPGEIAYMSRYDNISKTGSRFSLESFDENKRLTSRLTAQTIKWDTLYNWRVTDYVIRDFKDNREFITKGRSLDTIIPFQPRDFLISKNDHEKMTTPELTEYIDSQKSRGVANIKTFETEYQRRYAMTAAAFILTVIGMALSSRKVKGGMGVNIGIGLVLSFSYILFMTVTQTFALSGQTSPFIAMWIPNFIYTIIAIVLYRRASHA